MPKRFFPKAQPPRFDGDNQRSAPEEEWGFKHQPPAAMNQLRHHFPLGAQPNCFLATLTSNPAQRVIFLSRTDV
jgi:hypothetical protein